MTPLQARTKPQVHQAVLKIVSALAKGSKILDAPCGEGALLVRLKELGFFHMVPLPLNEAQGDPSHHITPLTLANLRYILHRSGFQIEKVTCSYVKPISLLYLVLVPWMALYTPAAFRREKNVAQRQRNLETLKWLFSPNVLLGEHLVLLTQVPQLGARTETQKAEDSST